MKFNIKTFLFPVLFIMCLTSTAQETLEKELDTFNVNNYRIQLDLAPFYPIAVGNNFASDAFSPLVGGQLGIAFKISKTNFLAGVQFNFFKANIKDSEFVGNYQQTNVTTYSLQLGYQFDKNQQIRYRVNAGFGPTNYNNQGEGFDFKDTAFTAWAGGDVSYHVAETLWVLFGTNLRRDFVNIDTPAMQNYLNHAYYITFNLGLRFNF